MKEESKVIEESETKKPIALPKPAPFVSLYRRCVRWLHDSIMILGILSAYLLISGEFAQDVGRELKERYEKQMAANAAKPK